jgi:hypothetical protein
MMVRCVRFMIPIILYVEHYKNNHVLTVLPLQQQRSRMESIVRWVSAGF